MIPVPAGYPIERVSGPLIVGYLLNWGLFGTLSIQLYLYYLAFPKDRRFVKSLVYGIYIIELVQTILIAHNAFALFGYGFGDLEVLAEIHVDWLVVPIMTAIVTFVGQCFYAYRIFILSKSRIIPAFVICVALVSFVVSIVTGVWNFQADDVAKIKDLKISISTGISCGSYALCDVVIAICMTYYLMRSQTSFRRTQILVTKLILLIIETGSLTAVIALVIPILLFAFPHEVFYYATPAFIISKMYSNTIYLVLNSRIRIMGGRDTYTSSTDTEITTTMMRGIASQSTQGAQPTPVVAVTAEVFTSDSEMGGMSEKPQDGDISLLA
ncbi:hypothetical protein EDD18DRAFT_1355039 [Armillaria luteobubalina]|uniref:DUF6534 domain-containing protein n=1 Tax=Armillaria luteobubalina TaxID=153913 RepID=A0AA39Q3E2_9AGAR|nr:hypothetical protein EDD18DRAFT_1355039 [Armillaria luteobubalina]